MIKLLTDTDLQFSDIAERCGFSYAEYFSTAFKQRFGVSPKEYRDKHQTNPREKLV